MTYIEKLLSINAVSVVTVLFLLLLASVEAFNAVTKFLSCFGLDNRWSRQRKAERDMLLNHEAQLRDVSGDVRAIKDNVNALSQLVVEMQEKSDASERAKLKDRLTQAYRYYKDQAEKTGVLDWSELEEDAFWSMYDDYVKRGGNHYVRDTIEPYMREFKVTGMK